jgi:phosphatidate phosphatase PAH1
LITAAGKPNHRGRDQIVVEGAPQWVIGKFAYATNDKDLKDEEVDVFVERGCAGAWEKLGTAVTTEDDEHAAVEGVPDTGGRIYFEIPAAKKLALGRHRLRLVVAGDHTSADLLIDVVAKDTKIVVSDVDGTLTSSEDAFLAALATGQVPEAQPDASKVLHALASSGYRIVYLTARPEWLTGGTRDFLRRRGFPTGLVHTITSGLTGAVGATGTAAVEFKTAELEAFTAKGVKIAWAFGNRDTDTEAYAAANIQPPDHRVFLQLDDPKGGRRIESYTEFLPVVSAAPSACAP